MDPMTAVSLASAIVQFVDYSTKLVNAANDIRRSASGATMENQSIEVIVSEMEALSIRLDPPRTGQPTDDEQALYRLATECRILSSQILGLLNKIKPKDPKSKRQSAWSAIKTLWSDREKKELLQRLQSCRSQLELQLSFLNSSDTKARLEALAGSAEDGSARLAVLQKHVSELRQGVAITSISTEAQKQLQGLLSLSEAASEAIKRNQILKALAFDNMHERFEDVDIAHQKTFEWIFDEDARPNHGDDAKSIDTTENDGQLHKTEDSSNAADDDEQTLNPSSSDEDTESEADKHQRLRHNEHDYSTRESFLHWLSSGNGIFHISGKLGSGKSTLMKFLCDHPRTGAELQRWAGQRKLIFAKFFFWKPGSKLQKSLDGLFRCLLHDVLQSCPELIAEALPEQWNKISASSGQVEISFHLRDKETREAFTRLIGDQKLYKKHCFCFFIDGLDEYEETYQENYRDMVDLLHRWTAAAPDGVKICVSSREYNVFLNSLPDDKRLRLQDLTKSDMERYIRDKLRGGPNRDITGLVHGIVAKASGIFLWVALVVRSLCERLEELDDAQDLSVLEKELDPLPDELEGLFRFLLKTVSKSARTTAYQTFAMLQILDSYSLDLSLLAYSFLEDYVKDPELAIRTSFPYAAMSQSTSETRVNHARKVLNGSTKGLVEAVNDSIKHTHRSIVEFLEKPEVQSEMAVYIRSFSAVDAISQLLLSELRTNIIEFDDEHWSRVVYSIVRMRAKFNADRPPYSFLESLESALMEHEAQALAESSRAEGAIQTLGTVHIVFKAHREEPLPPRVTRSRYWVTSPLYISARYGLEEYVCWRIRHEPSILDADFRTAILVSITEDRLFWGEKPSAEIFESLLERGLSPQAPTHTTTAPVHIITDSDRTFWEDFVLMIALFLGTDEGDISNNQLIGRVTEKFLNYGADPRLWLSTIPQSTGKDESSETDESPERDGHSVEDEDFEKDKSPEAYESAKEVETAKKTAKKDGYTKKEGRSPMLDFQMRVERDGRRIAYRSTNRDVLPYFTKAGDVSFRELLEYLNFDNKETLLKLIDRNIKQQERDAGSKNKTRSRPAQSEEGVRALDEVPRRRDAESSSSSTDRASEELRKSRLWRLNSWLVSAATSPKVTFGLGLLAAVIAPRLWATVVQYRLFRRQ